MEPLPKISCRFCRHLAKTFKALKEHVKDRHSLEYDKIKLALFEVDDRLRQMLECDIIE